MENRGFTLIELLTVIAILGILSTIVAVSLSGQKQRGRIAAGETADAGIFRGAGASKLVGEWRFNETTGATAVDSSGFGLDGTISGGVTLGDPGIEKTAFTFKAANVGTVTVPNSLYASRYLNNTTTVTVSAWIKPTFTPTGSEYVALRIQEFQFHIENNRRIVGKVWVMQSGSLVGGSFVYTPVDTLIPGEWQFITLSYDGSAVNLYLNGSLRASAPPTSNGGGPLAPVGQPLLIGSGGSAATAFDGSIDEVRVYNTALTAQEIGKLFAAGAPRHGLARALK